MSSRCLICLLVGFMFKVCLRPTPRSSSRSCSILFTYKVGILVLRTSSTYESASHLPVAQVREFLSNLTTQRGQSSSRQVDSPSTVSTDKDTMKKHFVQLVWLAADSVIYW